MEAASLGCPGSRPMSSFWCHFSKSDLSAELPMLLEPVDTDVLCFQILTEILVKWYFWRLLLAFSNLLTHIEELYPRTQLGDWLTSWRYHTQNDLSSLSLSKAMCLKSFWYYDGLFVIQIVLGQDPQLFRHTQAGLNPRIKYSLGSSYVSSPSVRASKQVEGKKRNSVTLYLGEADFHTHQYKKISYKIHCS